MKRVKTVKVQRSRAYACSASSPRLRRFAGKCPAALAAVAALSAQYAWADATWTGASSQDWNTIANWSTTPTAPSGNFFVNTAAGSNYPILSANSLFTPVDLVLGNGGTNSGRFDQRAGSLSLNNVTTTGNWLFVGRGANTASGVYNLADTSTAGAGITGFGTGSGSVTVGKLWVGGAAFNAGGTGTVNINTTGTITANSTQDFGGANASAAAVTLGYGAGSSGTVNMENGTVNANSEMWTGYSGAGTWNQAGGTVNSTSYFVVGRNSGGVGVYNLSGGSVNAATSNAGSFATLASFSGATGTLSVSGTGSFTVAGNRRFYVGEGGTGILNVSGAGLVTVNDTTNGGLRLGANAGAVGTVNLNGGTIQTMLVSQGAGSGTFNFNGGTLKAGQSTASFMTGLNNAYIQAGGAVFDTNSFNVTVAQPLNEDGGSPGGGLTKNSAGTLSLAGSNSYTGPTAVNAGTLAFSTATSSVGNVSVANNAGLRVGAVGAFNTTLNAANVTLGTAGTPGGSGPSSLTFDFNNLNTSAPLISTGTLTANGAVNVSLVNGGSLSSGPHTLIGYSAFAGNGTFTGSPFTITPRSTGTLVNNGTDSLVLNVTADNPVWTGAATGAAAGVWSTATVAPPKNWVLATAGTPTDYLEGDVVVFDDSATGTTAVNIASANVSPTSTTFNNDSKSYTLSSSGGFGIAGTGALTKTGSGSLVITTVNTYTGATTIAPGATLTLGDGTSGHDGTIASTSGVTDNGTLAFNRFAASTAAYAISGIGSVTITGTGTQTLSGTNTYGGGTTVSGGGTVSVAADANLGAVASPSTFAAPLLLDNGTLVTTAGFIDTHPITIGPGGGTINVTTTGQLFMNTVNTLLGSGTLNLVGGNGTLTANTGNLRVAQTNAFNGPVNVLSGGIFEYGVAGAVDPASTFTIGKEGELAVQGGGATSFPNAVTVTGGTDSVLSFENGTAGNYTGPITLSANAIVGLRDWYNYATVRGGTISGQITGTGGIAVNSGTGNGGLLTLSNDSNTYSGGTTISASRVLAGTNAALGTGPVTVGGTNAQLQLASGVSVPNAITISAGAGTTAQGVVWVPTASANAAVSGAITINAAAGAGGHFAANGGTLTVSGPITASVPVSIRLGTVVFSNTASSYSALSVVSGTAQLGATNAIPTAASVDLAAGNALPGTLDLAGFNQALAGLTKNAAGSTATVTNSATGTLSTLTTTGTSAYSGLLQDGAGQLALKVTGGSLTLSGAAGNTYTGGTTVTGGSLIASNTSGSATGSGPVTITGGATLGGAGSIAGPATLAGAGSRLSPGNSPGILTLTANGNALTFSTAGGAPTYAVDLNGTTAGTGYDQVLLTGNGTTPSATAVLGGATLALTNGTGGPFPAGTTFVILDNNTSGAAPAGQFARGTTAFDNLGNPYTVNYAFNAGDAGGANDVALVALPAPEPASMGVLGLAAVGLLARRRRGQDRPGRRGC